MSDDIVHNHNCPHDDKKNDTRTIQPPKLSMDAKQKKVTDTISTILSSLTKMDEDTHKYVKSVENEFDFFLEKLSERKNVLIKELQSITLDKKEILNKQIGELNEYKKELKIAKFGSEASNTIIDKNVSLHTEPLITLSIDTERITRYISEMGDLNNSFPPNPPSIDIAEIKAHSAKIMWSQGIEKYGGYKKATNYVIELAEDSTTTNNDEKEKELIFKEIARKESKRFARITKLKPSTNYFIRVKCSNKYGWSEWCEPKRFTTFVLKIDTKIMTSDEIEMLINIMIKQRNKENVRWKLKYRGSDDGFLAKTFHKKCDDVPNTVCIIASNHGNVFGAFTRLPWKSDVGRYHVDEAAFVFILRKKNKKLPNPKVYLQYTSSQHSVVHNKYMGPVFGYGHDIFIRNKCNEVDDNSCRNHTYQCSYAGELAGEEKFKVINIETFQIEHN